MSASETDPLVELKEEIKDLMEHMDKVTKRIEDNRLPVPFISAAAELYLGLEELCRTLPDEKSESDPDF